MSEIQANLSTISFLSHFLFLSPNLYANRRVGLLSPLLSWTWSTADSLIKERRREKGKDIFFAWIGKEEEEKSGPWWLISLIFAAAFILMRDTRVWPVMEFCQIPKAKFLHLRQDYSQFHYVQIVTFLLISCAGKWNLQIWCKRFRILPTETKGAHFPLFQPKEGV